MEPGKPIAVVYATDENYVKLTAVSMVSLLKANPGTTVYLLADRVSASSLALLRERAERFGGTLQAVPVEAQLKQVSEIGAGRYVAYAAYARLFLPVLLPATVERVVYLDSDTLVTGSLAPLASLDLKGKAFAIGYDCLGAAYKQLVGLKPSDPYYNSGVLVMDLREWRRRRCAERIFEHMRKVRCDYLMGDQDYFSVVLAEDAAVLPPAYNFLTHFQLFKTQRMALLATKLRPECWYSREAYAEAQRQPVIRHFLGHTLGRPWYRQSRNPLRPRYVQAAAEAGVSEVAEQSRPLEFCYRVQERCWRWLPQPLFALACRVMYSYFFWRTYGV